MGHQLEYLVALPLPSAQEWLSRLDGWWATPEAPDEKPWGEFLWAGLSLLAELAPAACHLRVPGIKYSWLIGDHGPSLDRVAQFEHWLAGSLPGVQAVRVDELLRLQWESRFGRTWDQRPDPVRAIGEWLMTSGQDTRYYVLLQETQVSANEAIQRTRSAGR
jgi:hypothetical protein